MSFDGGRGKVRGKVDDRGGEVIKGQWKERMEAKGGKGEEERVDKVTGTLVCPGGGQDGYHTSLEPR